MGWVGVEEMGWAGVEELRWVGVEELGWIEVEYDGDAQVFRFKSRSGPPSPNRTRKR